jgi:transforming growth factor-beta-induced protein
MSLARGVVGISGLLLALSAVVALPLAAAKKDIVDTAVENEGFTTLAKALTKAKLIDALKGEGPFTVFAPNDAAFDKAFVNHGFGSKTVEELLERADLADILKYHVVAGSTLMSKDLKEGEQKVKTLQGSELTVTVANGEVKLNNGKAVAVIKDLECTNGVIHVIDTVLVPPKPDIVDTAVANGSFTVLAAALTKAGLVDALKGEGPFTVFAPTDDAFAAALKALGITKEELLARADLADILKYHVVAGSAVMSKDLKDGEQKVKTLQGSDLSVTVADGKVTLNDGKATVVTADLACSNGVIHVIDAVVLPPQQKDIVDTAVANGSFTVLAAALTKAGLVDALKGEGPFTVFAPTDDAFAAALTALGTTKEELLARADLGKILQYHVVGGSAVMSKDLKEGEQKVVTLEGSELNVKVASGKVMVNDATVIAADVEASNGVIHVIDKVLLPPAPQQSNSEASGAQAPRAAFGALTGLMAATLVALRARVN